MIVSVLLVASLLALSLLLLFSLIRYCYKVDANGLRARCWSCLEDCGMNFDCATEGVFRSTKTGAYWWNRKFRSSSS